MSRGTKEGSTARHAFDDPDDAIGVLGKGNTQHGRGTTFLTDSEELGTKSNLRRDGR
jgi:hypothetical protein